MPPMAFLIAGLPERWAQPSHCHPLAPALPSASQRFLEGGPHALTEIAPGRGRRVTYGAGRVNQTVRATTQTKPPGATH